MLLCEKDVNCIKSYRFGLIWSITVHRQQSYQFAQFASKSLKARYSVNNLTLIFMKEILKKTVKISKKELMRSRIKFYKTFLAHKLKYSAAHSLKNVQKRNCGGALFVRLLFLKIGNWYEISGNTDFCYY